ncbi:type I secretion system permease/ATPase [Halarcobacter anaerophilus]|uniref:type I secretion system permease/ATPase n=1 Tax=Halarcobacter anaerophilus TaxID=877500 RepID=UPI001164A9C4|nr:type I secretion system permease/ATPase [Halarcobacter anaerophilus]QDF30145.1 type I secretion system ATPase/permease, LssB family [Halarcobacter anaerophilus]
MSNTEIDQFDEKVEVLQERRKVDTLLESLLFLAKFYQRATSKESLIYGMALHNSIMDVDTFILSSKKIGLISKFVSREKIKDISKLALPVVLITDKSRSMVLLDYDLEKNEAIVMVPGLSEGQVNMKIDELEDQYVGKAIIIKPEYNFENRVTNSIIIPKPQKWFWDAIKRNKDIYLKTALASIFINMFVIATPLFTMNVYDRVLPNNAIDTLWALAIGILFVMLFDLALKLIRSYYLGKASKRADVVMSNKIFDQLLNLRLEERPASTGMFVNRLQSFESIRDFFATATITTLVDIPFIFIFVAIIFYIGGALGWISIASIFITLIFSWFIKKPIKKTVEASTKEDQIKHTTLNETVAGLDIIKSVRGQNRMKTHWDKSINQTVYHNEKSQFLSQIATYFTTFISQFSNIAIVIGGVYLASEGEMTMGGIIASMILNGRVIAPISHVVGMIIRFDRTMLSLRNIDEVMNMQVERENKTYLSRPDLKGDIEFKDVVFSYKTQNFNALKGINLKIKEGEKVAILGKIGSGKSTLIKLLQNLYVPTSGSVLVDQTDVRQIDPVDLRRAIGVVPQEPFLFMGSIKDNITIGEPFATDEEVLRASMIAGVHDFLSKHESGYDLIVGERGEGLSGGEIQSVALARALVSNPNIMILDEPTNSMDRQTEKVFIDKMSRIIKDKTLILITHKVSILSLVDRVIVLENGQVIADGKKEEIFAKGGNIR